MSQSAPASALERKMACFRVGEEEYAIDIMRIKEIINPIKVTPVPGSSELLEGVVNLRGVIIPLVDLRKRFGVPARDKSERPKFIIVSVHKKLVGIVVDEVRQVVSMPLAKIRPAPELFSGHQSGLFVGVSQVDNRLLLLLNLKKVLEPIVGMSP